MLSDSISPGSKESKMKILLGGAQDIGKRDDQQDVFYISTPVFGHTE